MLNETALNQRLGQHISQICGVGFRSDSDNDCAHFESRAGIPVRSNVPDDGQRERHAGLDSGAGPVRALPVPRKHAGIFCGVLRQIWHYSNGRRQVVRQTVEEFSRHYPAPHNAMFWGSAP